MRVFLSDRISRFIHRLFAATSTGDGMELLGKDKKQEKPARQESAEKAQERRIVKNYARGSVVLLLGNYTTEEEHEERKAKLAAMDL